MKVCEKCGCINHGRSTHCTDCGALLRLKEQDDGSVAEMVERQMDTEYRLVPSGFEKGFHGAAWVRRRLPLQPAGCRRTGAGTRLPACWGR